jgi:GNAT superfamily N-acetyltransferase
MLHIVPAAPDRLEEWRSIHNAIIPTAPLSADEVAERATRNRLTLGYDGGSAGALVGNATVRPPGEDGTATVIVRILPEHRRRGLGSAYLEHELAEARVLEPQRIETVVLASNEDGLAFALARGFVEVDRYLLDGDTIPFVDLRLADRGLNG